MRRLFAAALVLLTCAALSCSDGDDGLTGPTTGALEVTLSMAGEELDPDGCQVSVDGGSPQVITRGSPVSFTGLAAGSHTVLLDDVASNCTVEGLNPRSVSVAAGTTTPVTFSVECSATTGSLEVLLTMTGEYLDADGCQVSIDGGDSRLLEPGAPVLFTELLPDAHSLLVDGVAANCSIQGENPRNVGIVAGQTTQTTYVIECTPCGVGWIGYEATDLGTLGGANRGYARGINDRRQVVGHSYVDSKWYQAFLWEDGVMTDLGNPLWAWSSAWHINNLGQVIIGSWAFEQGRHAFLWEDGVVTDIGESYGTPAINDRGQVVGFLYLPELRFAMWQSGLITDFGSPSQFAEPPSYDMDDVESEAVNDHGQVIVNVHRLEPPYEDCRAVLWDDGAITELGAGYGTDINDHGQAVGWHWLWEDGALTLLEGFDAKGINDCGQVVGQVRTSAGARHAALWENGVITDLGTLDDSYPSSGAYDINIHGDVVGYSCDAGDPGSSEDDRCRPTLWTPIR